MFSDKTDIYFARQQISERLLEVRPFCRPAPSLKMGPISTGLGEIYMWTVQYAPDEPRRRRGAPGWQRDGSYLTPEGQQLSTDFQRAAYLRTVQDWIIRPQIKGVPGVAGVDSIGGYVKQYQVQPDPAKLIALRPFVRGHRPARVEANNVSRGASYIERNGEGYVVRSGGRVENMPTRSLQVVVTTRGGVPVRVKDVADVTIGSEICAPAAPARTARRSSSGPR